MNEWTKVVANPLGLAGFALFLLFAYLARIKQPDQRRQIALIAAVLSVVALLGGLALAYLQVHVGTPSSAQSTQDAIPSDRHMNQRVQQVSTGSGSPNVQGVQGNVNITVDQSSGITEPIKPLDKQPGPAGP